MPYNWYTCQHRSADYWAGDTGTLGDENKNFQNKLTTTSWKQQYIKHNIENSNQAIQSPTKDDLMRMLQKGGQTLLHMWQQSGCACKYKPSDKSYSVSHIRGKEDGINIAITTIGTYPSSSVKPICQKRTKTLG